MANTRHDWLSSLEGFSATIASLSLKSSLPTELYRHPSTGAVTNTAAYTFSNSADHDKAIATWIDALANKGANPAHLRKLLTDLTGPNTYGTFCELAAYGAFLHHGIELDIQVRMPGTSILNPKGSDLDGRIQLNNEVLFDVKAFRAQDYLISVLLKRLQADFATEDVVAEGSWDVPLAVLEGLLGSGGYQKLMADLTTNPRVHRLSIAFHRRARKRVQISVRSADPYELAEHNADYAFKFAKQFPRRKRFLLVFVYHPWLGGLNNSVNFLGSADIYMRALARRIFLQFQHDRTTKLFGITRSAASRLISGLLFLDAWQDGSGWKGARLYLNPRAKSPLTSLDRAALQLNAPWLQIDDFAHDTY